MRDILFMTFAIVVAVQMTQYRKIQLMRASVQLMPVPVTSFYQHGIAITITTTTTEDEL